MYVNPISQEISFPSVFGKNADVSIFVEIQGKLSRKSGATPIFLCGFQHCTDKYLLVLHGPNLAKKTLYLVGTVPLNLLASC